VSIEVRYIRERCACAKGDLHVTTLTLGGILFHSFFEVRTFLAWSAISRHKDVNDHPFDDFVCLILCIVSDCDADTGPPVSQVSWSYLPALPRHEVKCRTDLVVWAGRWIDATGCVCD